MKLHPACHRREPSNPAFTELPPAESFGEVWRLVAGYRQTTDVYLACVALHHGTRLVTFDGRIRAIRPLRNVLEIA
ncbi:MAG: hypothetical protein HYY06_17110 [Deltaproteobacteria bacterium]|nr:hypothetical protein [Deltaproteobacteria bacterium]